MRRYQVKSTSKNILFELFSCLALLVCVSNTLATHWQHNQGKGHVTNTVELHWASAHVEEEEEEEEACRGKPVSTHVCVWCSIRMFVA